MDQPTFQRQLRLLSVATNKELSPELATLWWTKYGAHEDGLLTAAFSYALDHCRFFPSPAEFNDILAPMLRASGGALPLGEEVWGAVKRKIGRYAEETRGSMEACGFTPAEAEALREVGTLRELAYMAPRDLEFKKRDFIAAYERAAQRAALPAPTPIRRLGGA
jgi:hypothetical protein